MTAIAVYGDDENVQGFFMVAVRADGESETPPEGGSSETSYQEETPSQDDQSGTGSAGQDLQAAGSNALLWVMIMFFALALAAGGSVVLEQRKRRE